MRCHPLNTLVSHSSSPADLEKITFHSVFEALCGTYTFIFSPDTSFPIISTTVYSPQRDKLAKQSFKSDMPLSLLP